MSVPNKASMRSVFNAIDVNTSFMFDPPGVVAFESATGESPFEVLVIGGDLLAAELSC